MSNSQPSRDRDSRLLTSRLRQQASILRSADRGAVPPGSSISRSSFCHEPAGETDQTLGLMQLIDRQLMDTPVYGVRQMTRHLQNQGHGVNQKCIRRLMRLMRLMPIFQKRGQTINVDHVAAERVKINELDALAKEQERIRGAISEKNRPARKAGGGGRGKGGGSDAAELCEETKAYKDLADGIRSETAALNDENDHE